MGTSQVTLANKLGTAARAARVSLGLSQPDAAERIEISAEFYARIERGRTMPSVPTLVRMAEGLAVSTDTLLGGKPAPSAARRTESPNSPELRLLLRRLRRASPKTVRLLTRVLGAIEKPAVAEQRGRRRGR